MQAINTNQIQQAIIRNDLQAIKALKIQDKLSDATNEDMEMALKLGRLRIFKTILPELCFSPELSAEVLREVIKNGRFQCLIWCFDEACFLKLSSDTIVVLKDFFLDRDGQYSLEVKKKMFHTLLKNTTDEVAEMIVKDDSLESISVLRQLRYHFTQDDLRFRVESNREKISELLTQQRIVSQACQKENLDILKFLVEDAQFYYSQKAVEEAFETSLGHGQYLLHKGLYCTRNCKTVFKCFGNETKVTFDPDCYIYNFKSKKQDRDENEDENEDEDEDENEWDPDPCWGEPEYCDSQLESESESEDEDRTPVEVEKPKSTEELINDQYNFSTEPVRYDEEVEFWKTNFKKGILTDIKVQVHKQTGIVMNRDNLKFLGIFIFKGARFIEKDNLSETIVDWVKNCGISTEAE